MAGKLNADDTLSKVLVYVNLPFKFFALVVMCIFAFSVQAQDTNINMKGQPPSSAISPSLSNFGSDICAIAVVGSIQSTVIGFSAGTMYNDMNCERIKLSKMMSDLGLKVAAVGILCDDIRVWNAMEMSGSPCPINGLIGDFARFEWWKRYPKRFDDLYGKGFFIRVPNANNAAK
jgi:Ca2+-dependent lipid-binding protein